MTLTERLAQARNDALATQVAELTATVERLTNWINHHVAADTVPLVVDRHTMALLHQPEIDGPGTDDVWFIDCSCRQGGHGWDNPHAARAAMEGHAHRTGGVIVEDPDDPRITEYERAARAAETTFRTRPIVRREDTGREGGK